jgi:magnesium-protoporphyrin IX monomethyl ester (oxidative) cyclase
MRKGTTSFQNLKFLKNCGRYGIKAFWNLLVGFPNEPEEIYRKYYDDLPLLTHLQPPNGVYPIRFDRFSPYHADPAAFGMENVRPKAPLTRSATSLTVWTPSISCSTRYSSRDT